MSNINDTVDNQNEIINGINANTPIIFTTKSFAILMAMIIGIFFTFYKVFIDPKFNKIDQNYIELTKYQRQQTERFNEKFSNINGSISAINVSIKSINLRFRDISYISSISDNTAGSISSMKINEPYSFNDSVTYNVTNTHLSSNSTLSTLSKFCIIE